MAIYQVFQIQLSKEDLRQGDDNERSPRMIANFETWAGRPESAIKLGMFKRVCEIEAKDIDQVFEIGNLGPERAITRLAPMHSISVGNVIFTPEAKYMICDSIGWRELTDPESIAVLVAKTAIVIDEPDWS